MNRNLRKKKRFISPSLSYLHQLIQHRRTKICFAFKLNYSSSIIVLTVSIVLLQ